MGEHFVNLPGKRLIRVDGISKRIILLLLAALLPVLSATIALGDANHAYYVDSATGNDANNGLTPKAAWKSLQKAGDREYAEGEQLLLRKGCVFKGKLLLHAAGKADRPVIVGAYDADGGKAAPVIDAKGFLAGIQIVDSAYVEIRDLDITADGGEPAETPSGARCYGVFISVQKEGKYGHVALRSLRIHDIFAATPSRSEGKNPTTSMGVGIQSSGEKNARVNDLLIENCVIEKTGFAAIGLKRSDGVRIVRNSLREIGGPGIQPDNCNNLVVRGNVVDRSGSYVDKRMHGRGSGIWPWGCNDVLIENNAFMHARGKGDSCGAHIDSDNSDVVVQRNLSVDNEGGFVEILGNNRNCAYRYNISINDGARIKGRNGAEQNGRTLFVCGYVGSARPVGPFNNYIYNNTVFVKSDIRCGFEFQYSTQGLLVANNIFYALGPVENTARTAEPKRFQGGKFQNVIFEKNLITKELPPGICTSIVGDRLDDPQFRNPGGFDPADYVPGNKNAVQGMGAVILPLPGDSIGLKIGLQPETDFFGNKLNAGPPDLGAIVVGGALTKMPPCGAAADPGFAMAADPVP